MRTLILLNILLLSSCGVTHPDPNGKSDDEYNKLILNVAMAIPEYYCYIWTDKNDVIWAETEILEKDNEIYSEELGMRFVFHKWQLNSGFPKSLIYISDNTGVEKVFPFYDEYYNWRIYTYELKDKDHIWSLRHRMNFSYHLNNTIRIVGLDSINRSSDLDIFISTLFQELLSLEELKYKDISDLEKMVYSEIDSTRLSNGCLENIDKNLMEIIDDMKMEEGRYFKSQEGRGSFWRVSKKYKDGKAQLMVTFENKECYESFYF